MLIVNSYIINKFSKKEFEGLPDSNATISFINNIYRLDIRSDNYNIEDISVNILRETVRTIFYRILSYGEIPRDTHNSNIVKMIV